MAKQAAVLLADSSRGIHGPQHIATYYNLFIKCDEKNATPIFKNRYDRAIQPFKQYLESCEETIESYFDCGNEYYDDNLDLFERDCAVIIDGLPHSIAFIEGDIFAVHPDAEWCDEQDSYVFPSEQDINQAGVRKMNKMSKKITFRYSYSKYVDILEGRVTLIVMESRSPCPVNPDNFFYETYFDISLIKNNDIYPLNTMELAGKQTFIDVDKDVPIDKQAEGLINVCVSSAFTMKLLTQKQLQN